MLYVSDEEYSDGLPAEFQGVPVRIIVSGELVAHSAVPWSGIDDPESDLCFDDRGKYWDVVDGVDGWVVYTSKRERIVIGHVTRDEAQKRAEQMIREARERRDR